MQAPLSVPTGSAAPEATRRLAVFVDNSEALTPHQVRAVLRLTRSLCVAAAGGTAPGAGSEAPSLQRELGGLARALHQALDSDRGEAALTPVPAGAVEAQLRELLLFTRRTFAAGPPQRWWSETQTPRHLAQCIPGVVDAVYRHTAEQVAACRWAVRDLDERTERTGLRYAVASTVDPDRQSPLLRDLAGAAAAAGQLRAVAGPPAPSPAKLAVAAAPAHRALTDAIRRYPAPRPQLGHPARPGEGPPPRTR